MNSQNSIPTKKKNGKYVVDDTFRPRINNGDRVREIANKINESFSPQSLVNILVDVGCDCLEKAIEAGKKDIQKKISKLLK